MITNNPMALTVHPDIPARSLRAFVDYVRAHPGKINYSVGGNGSSSSARPGAAGRPRTAQHGRRSLSEHAARGFSTPGRLQVQMFFGNISDSIELVRSGKVRLLGLSSDKRSPQFPDVPTVAETVSGFSMIGWHGVFAPAGTPEPIIARLSGAFFMTSRVTRPTSKSWTMRASRPFTARPRASRRPSKPTLCYTRRRSKQPGCSARTAPDERDTRRRAMSMVSTREAAAPSTLQFDSADPAHRL